MVIAAVVLAAVALLIVRSWRAGDEPLDGHEIRIIRRLADRLRQEQCQPFD